MLTEYIYAWAPMPSCYQTFGNWILIHGGQVIMAIAFCLAGFMFIRFQYSKSVDKKSKLPIKWLKICLAVMVIGFLYHYYVTVSGITCTFFLPREPLPV